MHVLSELAVSISGIRLAEKGTLNMPVRDCFARMTNVEELRDDTTSCMNCEAIVTWHPHDMAAGINHDRCKHLRYMRPMA